MNPPWCAIVNIQDIPTTVGFSCPPRHLLEAFLAVADELLGPQ